MKFKLEMDMGNAAFDPACPEWEVARILKDIARRVEFGATEGKLRDSNGNTVGTFKTTGRR